MDKLIKRSNVEKKDKWNIEKVYKNDDEFNKEFDLCIKMIDSLSKLQDGFLDNKEKFKEYMEFDEKTSRTIEKLAIYTGSKNNEDLNNSLYQELDGKIVNLYSKYSKIESVFLTKILETDKSIIDRFLEDDSYLKNYKYIFERIYSKKEHMLDETAEKILAGYNPVLNSSSEIASYLRDADMKFKNIIIDNKEKELNEAVYSIYIRDNNREIRKQAFTNLLCGYGNLKNTLTAAYKSTVNNDKITSEIRKYNSSIEMYLKPNNITVELYDNLINTVRNNFKPLFEYFKLKKQILKLDEFHLFDSYVSIVDKCDRNYSFDEAKEIVLKALEPLGDDYIKVLKTAFTDGWIDKYPNIGKRSGAYSTGSYDTLPYVLLNYTNTLNDVSTLAHELGHSMHTYLSNNNNPYATSSYPIFLAEIASTTNELLLNDYMFKNSKSKEEKLNILNNELDLFKATIYRQVMFAEFEKKVHEYNDQGNILTSDYLCKTYYELNKDYFGEDVVVDKEIQYEWLRIPHFYTPFYVYQYATSLSIACYIRENIINKTPGFVEKYLEFLKSGGRDYPLNVLKIIDIDLSDNKVFLSAIHSFENTLENFKKTYND